MTLSAETIRTAFVESLLDVAPEADLSSLRPDRPMRTQLDIDSFDFLRVLEAFHARTGIEVPEADYARMETFSGALAYLEGRGTSG